ncbi:hypothetical protein CR194_05045 [Salipaludibacillus keqinensis]|uniref:Uncharacterized protein n=1 Tax=Salipaludibacillus keqinensis TaxID=2045207 RepID=A0A323TID6_9BACI|nr:hypothetical protein CR194_05045 [Salipaludibacillus keqinensis]
MFKHVLAILFVSCIFGIISYDTYVMKTEPTLFHATSSITFVILWVLYGVSMGKKKTQNFISFITIYWITSASILLFGYFTFIAPLFYSASFIFTISIYGAIRYYFDTSPSLSLGIISALILYVSCTVGYLLGLIWTQRQITS